MRTATLFFAAMLALLATPTGQASCPSDIVFSKSPQTLGVVRTFDLDIGDVDRDGDNDVFIASYHYYWVAPSRLWLNNGDGTFSLSPQSFPVSDGHGVAIRDFNGDTYLDIFLIGQPANKVFFGDGAGSFTMGSQDIAEGSNLAFQVGTGDIDNDGDLDVVIGTGTGPQVWLNDGTGVFTLASTLCNGRVGRVSLADLNGDTYPDIFVALIDSPDEVWLNDGSGSFVNSGQALEPGDGDGYSTTGDIDGDGDIDVVVGNLVHGSSVWLNQNNTGTFVDAGPYLDSGSYRAALFDADSDGDLDMITARSASGTKVWTNNGAGSFSLVGPILGSPRGLAIGCADLDGDGDDDIVLGYLETEGGNPIYINQTDNCYGTAEDIDGNSYCTVKIGDQEWMAENLKVTHYRDGSPLPLVSDSLAWVSQTAGAYCNYANDTANVSSYGRLYNWYAATSSHKIAPAGWRIPSQEDWQTLLDYLGGNAVAGRKLKEAGLAHWVSPNDGTNEAGFTALPGGYRGSAEGVFADLGNYATFWTSTPVSGTHAWYESIRYDNPAVDLFDSRTFYGFSLRCIKDSICCEGTRGNVDRYGIVDLVDLAFLVAYLTVSAPYKPILPCDDEANVNGSGIIDLADLSLLIAYLTATPRPTLPNCP